MGQPLGRRLFACCLALALALAALPVGAQEKVSAKELQRLGFFSDFDELDLEALLEAPVEETSLATGFRVPVTEAPGAVTLLSDEAIRNLGARTLRDVLMTVPGFDSLVGSLGQQQLVVRGQPGFTSSSSEGVLVLYGGVSLGEPIFGGATAVNLDLPVDNLARIEILRGPAAALYGSGAVSAVVNLVPRGSEDLRGIQVTLGGGSFRHKRVLMQMGAKLKGLSLTGFLAFDDRDASGLEVPVDAQTRTDDSDLFLAPLSIAPGPVADERRSFTTFYRVGWRSLTLDWRVSQEEAGGLVGAAELLSPQNKLNNRQMTASLAWTRKLGGGTLEARGTFDQSQIGELDQIYPPFYEVLLPNGRLILPSGVLFQGSFKSRGLTGEASFDRAFGEHHVLFGVQAHREKTRSLEANGNVDFRTFEIQDGLAPLPGVVQDVGRDTLSAFANAVFKPASILRLSLGARFDHVSDQADSLVSPRVAAVLPLPHSITLKAGWSRAHRLPSFAETSFNLPLLSAGSNLEPVKTDSLEAALGFAWKSFTLQATAFQADVASPLMPREAPSARSPSVVINGPDYRARGVELDVRGAFGPHTAFANLTAQSSEYDTGGELAGVPPVLANAGVSLQVGRGLILSPSLLYRGERPRAAGDSRAPVSAYPLVNLGLCTKELFRRWDFSARVSNLFSKEYHEPSPVTGLPGDYPRLGRTVLIHATYRF